MTVDALAEYRRLSDQQLAYLARQLQIKIAALREATSFTSIAARNSSSSG
jgi:hypothetical protein